jgi:hypothetical protein
MEPEHGHVGGSYQRVSEQLNNWFMPLFSYELTQISKSKSASIGSPRGSLGQIPYNCALSDCCDYAVSNGQRHLGALARALDSSAVDPIRDQIHKNRKLILIDLGSGPGLSWLLFTELLLGQSHPAEMTVVNIDHSKNMHLIARRAKEIASSIHPELQSLDFRFATDSKFIDSFTSDELQSDTTILLILNHILHQSSETKEAVPNFVSHALDNISRLAKRSGTDKILGISIEPARLNIGFGKTGLIQEIHRHHGSVIANAEIAGDRAGKGVTTFSF